MSSLLIHLGLLAGLFLLEKPILDSGPITIEILDDSSSKPGGNRLIVTETENDNSDEDLLEKLKSQNQLLSQYAKRVKKQQINRGDSDRSGARGRHRITQNTANKKLKQLDLKPRKKLFAAGLDVPKPRKKNNIESKELGAASALNRTFAIGGRAGLDQIPGVEEGSFTSLNTDQFKYYSFFSRVSQAISYRWVSRVRKFAKQAAPSEIFQLSQVPSPTLLEIFLDRDGMVVQVDIRRSSGSEKLDNAAVQAFYQASPLNHPPDGMIDPETRMVKLNFSFLVRWNPVYTARGKNR